MSALLIDENIVSAIVYNSLLPLQSSPVLRFAPISNLSAYTNVSALSVGQDHLAISVQKDDNQKIG